MKAQARRAFTPGSRRVPRTLVQLIEVNAALRGENDAIQAPGRRPLSYGRLLEEAKTTISIFRALGITQTDRVAVVLPNGPEMAVAFLAAAAGAVCAPLDPTLQASEFKFRLSDLRAKVILIGTGLDTAAREAAQALDLPVIDVLPVLDGEAGTFQLVGEPGEYAADCPLPGSDDVALVLHASGQTPKVVGLTQLNLCSSGNNIRQALALTPEDRCLNVMPLVDSHGLIGALLSTVTAGASVICSPGFDSEKFFEWLDVDKPTWFTATPTMLEAILARAPKHPDIITSNPLRFIRSSSGVLPQSVLANLEQVFGTYVIEAYGMTEAGHQATSHQLEALSRKPGSVGTALGSEVAVMDGSGALLAAGHAGEIVIRGPSVIWGYERNPSANESAFTNGWFRTGDRGWLDEDGYLFLAGDRQDQERAQAEGFEELGQGEIPRQQAVVDHTPKISVEDQLIALWKDVLKVDEVDVRDRFYTVGGDAVDLVTLIRAVEERFQKSVSWEAFLESPTIETLATLLDQNGERGRRGKSARKPAVHAIVKKMLRRCRDLTNQLLQGCALHAPGHKSTRVWLHRLRGVSIGDNVSIGPGVIIEPSCPGLVSIGHNVSIGMRTIIIARNPEATFDGSMSYRHRVKIESGAYVGAGSMILPDVTIGQGAVVNAGSVVSRTVPPRTLVRGNPAEPIAHCGIVLGGGVSYEQFVRNLKPIGAQHPL